MLLVKYPQKKAPCYGRLFWFMCRLDYFALLKQSRHNTGLSPLGSNGTVSCLPQLAQVIGKLPRDPCMSAFFLDLQSGQRVGGLVNPFSW